MSSNPGGKSRESTKRTENLPRANTSTSIIFEILPLRLSFWRRVLTWLSLYTLLSLASSCWSRAFEPQFGASWHDPWWAQWVSLCVYLALDIYRRFFANNTPIKHGEYNSNLALCFVHVAWLQAFQWWTSPFLNQWQAFAIRLLLIELMKGYALDQMAKVEDEEIPSNSAETRSSYSSWIRIALGLCNAHLLTSWMPRDGYLNYVLDFLILRTPYWLLPSGFLASGVVTAFSAIMAVVSARSSKLRRSKLQPATWLLLASLPVFHSIFIHPHSPIGFATTSINTRLDGAGYELLARGDGRATGYVSVIQNNKDGFRAMRCGHSLLGGYWLQSPGVVKDPIYGVFVMLEAVRLVLPAEASEQVIARQERLAKSGSVLVIGLGIGTAPAAFIHHGMDVTIVEIDQIVYDYAVEYFDLPPRHRAVIGDAIEFVHTEQAKLSSKPRRKDPSAARGSHPAQYDFIVHDVFTGGVEPAELFTVEFLIGLKDLLRPYGTIAINYAGDFKLGSSQMVLRTILAVFPSCRMFRESVAADSSEAESDQTNLVLFCRKVAGDFEFRRPTSEDFLGAPSREQWLMPMREAEVEVDLFKADCTPDFDCFGPNSPWYNDFLWNKNVHALEKWQHEAGKRHWELMRTVIPPVVWDNW